MSNYEIERKFLVSSDIVKIINNEVVLTVQHIIQVYAETLNPINEFRIRKVVNLTDPYDKGQYFATIKVTNSDLVRTESDVQLCTSNNMVNESLFEGLLRSTSSSLSKIRYVLLDNVTVDMILVENKPYYILEVEFDSVESAKEYKFTYNIPHVEVTHDPNYRSYKIYETLKSIDEDQLRKSMNEPFENASDDIQVIQSSDIIIEDKENKILI